MAIFNHNPRGGLTTNLNSLHASIEYRCQVEALRICGKNNTMNKESMKAIEDIDIHRALRKLGLDDLWRWSAVKQSLLDMDEEIVRLQSGLAKHVTRVTKLTEAFQRSDEQAEQLGNRLAKADALLRDIADCQWFNREAHTTVELIHTYLQESAQD